MIAACRFGSFTACTGSSCLCLFDGGC